MVDDEVGGERVVGQEWGEGLRVVKFVVGGGPFGVIGAGVCDIGVEV